MADYVDDFSKHAPIEEIEKLRMIWDSIPKQLAKENNKFVFSHVKEGKRAHELENALQWLRNAGLIHLIEKVQNAEVPLAATNTQAKSYKNFCKKYAVSRGYKLSLKNIAVIKCEGKDTVSLPLYLLWNIDNI